MPVTELEDPKRSAVALELRQARKKKGLNLMAAAEAAEDALRQAAIDEKVATDGERELWLRIEITRHHLASLEAFPRAPLGTPARRARLLGLVLALGIDRARMNRLAGGL